MTRKSAYRLGSPGDFRPGEQIPLKGLNFEIAHVERGVLILALKGFTKAGIEALARLQAQYSQECERIEQEETLDEVSKDMLLTENKQ